MTQAPDCCPPDPAEAAEAYCMGTLNAADAAVFEDHYITCEKCAAIVEDAYAYVQAMQDATRKLRASARKRAEQTLYR